MTIRPRKYRPSTQQPIGIWHESCRLVNLLCVIKTFAVVVVSGRSIIPTNHSISATRSKRMSSYQNGGPRTIEEIGVSAPDLHRKKAFRQILFGSLGVLFLVTFLAMAQVVHQHQKQSIEGGEAGVSSFVDPTKSLNTLNLRTNRSAIETGCETTILLFRHCEKDGDETFDKEGNEHCSYVGYERAYFIPSLFGPPGQAEGNRWPIPTALFALTPTRSDNLNFREVETLTPLASKYGLKIESDVHHNIGLTKDLFKGLTTGKWCGKTVLVSWKHEYMASLARNLGCADCPDTYPDTVFDEVWEFKYVFDVAGTAVIQDSHRLKESAGTAVPNNKGRRALRRKKSRRSTGPQKMWSVYSTITQQNFDPLKFSYASGDYTDGSPGGKWYQPRPQEGSASTEGEM